MPTELGKYERMFLEWLCTKSDFVDTPDFTDFIVSTRMPESVAVALVDRLQPMADAGWIRVKDGVKIKITVKGKGVVKSAESDRERQEVLSALDRTGLDTDKFDNWMEAQGYGSIMPYAGTFSMKGHYGIVSYVVDWMDDVSRIMACVYTPDGADVDSRHWEGRRPDRIGDYYRMVLAPTRQGKPPWPGGIVLVSGGVSASGGQVPTTHLAQIKGRVQELQNKPPAITVIQVIAFNSGWLWSEMTPELTLEDDLFSADDYKLEDLTDVFEIAIDSLVWGECKTVQDAIDLVMRQIVIQIIADNYNDGKDADVIEPDETLYLYMDDEDFPILAEKLAQVFRIEIDSSDMEEWIEIQHVIDVVKRKSDQATALTLSKLKEDSD